MRPLRMFRASPSHANFLIAASKPKTQMRKCADNAALKIYPEVRKGGSIAKPTTLLPPTLIDSSREAFSQVIRALVFFTPYANDVRLTVDATR